MATNNQDEQPSMAAGLPQASGQRLRPAQLSRAPSSGDQSGQQEIFMLPRQKSKSRERRESRMFLVDGQLCWADDFGSGSGAAAGGQSSSQSPGAGFAMGKRSSSIGLMFGSSMDLSNLIAAAGQSIDSSGGAGSGSGSEEAISYRIKWCRENILQLKRQCWPMEKKLQVLKASKLFIKQHQGELNQSKQAKDVLANTSAIFERYWRHFKREFANFLVIITPWEMRIKKIESHFGSVVASYFTFLRWIFWLNLANSLVMCSFVMVPELIENVPDLTGLRKGELGMQRSLKVNRDEPERPVDFNPTLSEMWEFEGFLKFSPIFYGYYSNVEISRSGFWRNPLAFLLSAMITYLFCFFCISRKLSQNTKLSRIGSKDDEYTFCWTVFVGWDFMIGNSETAYNKTSSLVMNLKEGILEEKEQTKDRDWRLILRRVFANVLTIMLIIASAYVVTLAVQRSENLPEDASLLQKNELQLVMTGIQFTFPPLFDGVGMIEKYHPRKALSWQLGRILCLDFLNFYTLMFSLFGSVDKMSVELNEVSGNISVLRKNATYYNNLFTTTTTTTTTTSTTPSTTVSTTESTTTTPETTPLLVSNTTSNRTLEGPTTVIIDANTTTAPVSSTSFGTIPPITTNSISEVTSTTAAVSAETTISSITTMPSNASSASGQLATGSDTPDSPTVSARPPDGAGADSPGGVGRPLSNTTRETSSEASTKAAASDQVMSTSVSNTIPTTVNPDEDYPDIQEALLASGSRRGRRKRQASEGEQEETVLVGVNRPASQIDVESFKSKETHQRLAAGLPPIKDPYGKLGIQFRVNTQTSSSEPSDRAAISTLPVGRMGFSSEQDEEEPLEGRLGLDPTPRMSSSKASSSEQVPKQAAKPGRARPITGMAQPSASGRVVATSPPKGNVESNLNSDNDEDLVEETSAAEGRKISTSPDQTPVANSEGEAPEPLTPAPGPSAASSIPMSDLGSVTSTLTSMEGEAVPPIEVPPAERPLLPSSRSAGGELLKASSLADESALAASKGLMDGQSGQSASGGCSLVQVGGSDANKSAGIDHLNSTPNKVNSSAMEDSEDCVATNDFKPQEILGLNDTLRDKLKTLCWETMFGQEMVKIVVMDLVMTIASAVTIEFMRACFVRYCNRFFFWDLERGIPGYQDFKLAENVLHLVNNQSTVWMGMFFAPGLPAINTVKLAVLMYIRSWAVLTCNIPHETVFKVSKSNNFYYWILLINLLICILPVAYAVTWIKPSWHCGPFGGECRMYLVVTKLVKQLLPPEANSIFRYITSPGAVIPILIALILIIYYLASTVSSSKEANKELKAQLKKDKDQEAAVPEITSTTVSDPANAAAAVPATNCPDALVATSTPNAGAAAAAAAPRSDELTRFKSLLAPPKI